MEGTWRDRENAGKHKGRRRKSRGTKNSKRKNYMLLIIFMVLIFNSLSFFKTKKATTYVLPMASTHTKRKLKNHAFVTFLPNLALNRARYNSTAPQPRPSLIWEGNWGIVAETGQKKKSSTRHVILAFMKPFISVRSLWSWGGITKETWGVPGVEFKPSPSSLSCLWHLLWFLPTCLQSWGQELENTIWLHTPGVTVHCYTFPALKVEL